RLEPILARGGRVVGADEARAELLGAVRRPGGSTLVSEEGWIALRTRYRELLAELTLYDLEASREGRATEVFEEVAGGLSDLAAAAVEASLAVALATLAS